MQVRCLLIVLLHLGNTLEISETVADPLVSNTLITPDLVSRPPLVFLIPDRYALESMTALDLFTSIDRIDSSLAIYS